MKRLSILFISLLFSIFAMSQPFSTIASGESGLSVRTNLNNLINYVNDLGWKVQFSSDKEGWHDDYAVGDYYIRFSTDYGDTYTNPVLIFDGQTVIDSLDMNNNGIINMQAGINANDAVTLGQMMDSLSTINEGLWTAGTSGRIYYNSGVVGIGTAAPSTSYALHVAGKSIFQSNIIVQDGGVPLFETFGSNVYMPNLPKAATSNILFYNSENGTISYGDTVSGGGGATSFLNLPDVDPSSYSGQSGNYVRVNSGEDGLEFASGTGGTPWVSDANGITYTAGNVGIGSSPSPSTFALGVSENSNTFAISVLNNNAAGDGIRVGTSGTTGTDRIIDAYSMTGDVFSARADGALYAPNIGTAKKANILFYDTTNGLITYGDTTNFGGGGGDGTVTSVSSATTNQLTVANGTTTPALSIVTGAVANSGTALATGDQIYDFVTGQGYMTSIGAGAVEASMLNNNIISGKPELASGLASTDELMVSDAGAVKRMDVSVLQTYMQNNLNFEAGEGGVSQLSDLSDVNTSTPTNKNVLIADGTDWESRALTEADISDFGTYLESESDPAYTNDSASIVWFSDLDTLSFLRSETDPKRVSSAAFSGTSTKTLTLTLADNSTVQASFTDMVGEAGTGDNWGTQAVVTDATLTGDGTAGDALKVDTTVMATITEVKSIVSDSISGLGGTPGGSIGDIQYNNSGSFGGFGVFDGSKFQLDNGDRFQAYGSAQVYPYAMVTPAGIGWSDTDDAMVDIGLVYDDEDEIFTTVGGFKPLNIIDEDMQYGQAGYVLKKTATGLKWSAESGGMTYPASSGIVTYNSGTGTWATSITNNSTNWNTAYSWGDHSAEGYLTQVDTTSTHINRANWLTFLDNNVTGGAGLELPSGFGILTTNNGVWGPVLTDNSANWNTAYNDKINSASFATGTGVLTLTQQDAGPITVDLDGRFLTQADTTATNIVDANWKAYIANHSTGGSSVWTSDTYGITYPSGSVGIGGASASGIELNVTGEIEASGQITGGSMTSNGNLSIKNSVPQFYMTDTDDNKSIRMIYQSSSDVFGIENSSAETIFYSANGSIEIGVDSDDEVIVGLLNYNATVQNVLNGSKASSFTHDASLASIGDYSITNSSANTISIHNLEVGMQGTIFVYMGAVPASLTVNTYSDAGTTGLTEVVIGNASNIADGKTTSITYTCTNNGASTRVFLVYGQEQ